MSCRRLAHLACILHVLIGFIVVHSVWAQEFVVESAQYMATLRGKKFDVSAEFVTYLTKDGRTFVPLLPPNVGIAELKVTKGDAHPFRGAAGAGIMAEKKGEYRLMLRFVLDVEERGRTGRVTFPLSGAGKCWINLTLPPGQKVKTRPDAVMQQVSETSAKIFPQNGNYIEIEWYPIEYEKEASPVVHVREVSTLIVEAGLITRRVKLGLAVIRGPLERVEMQLPPGAEPRTVRGDGIKHWEFGKGERERRLIVVFSRPLQEDTSLEFCLEEPFTMGSQMVLQPILVTGAGQHQGRFALLVGAEVILREVGLFGARKAEMSDQSDKAALVYVYESLPAEVRLVAEAARPRMSAYVQTLAVLERGIITLTSRIEYSIRGARVRIFKIKLPADLSVSTVTGPGPLDWTTEADVLHVRLRSHAESKCTLQVEAQQNLTKMNGIPIPRLETMDTESEIGVLGVAVGPDVNLIPFGATKTRQIDAVQLPDWMQKCGAKLGYAYSERGGTVAVSTIKLEPHISVKVHDFMRIGEGEVLRRITCKYLVKERPALAFRVKFPPGMTVTDVAGAHVRDWHVDLLANILIINLVSEVTGESSIEIAAGSRLASTGSVSQASFEWEGAEKVEGILAVAPRGYVDLKAASTTGLTSMPVSEVGPISTKDQPPVLAYKFGRVEWTLLLEATPLVPEFDAKLFSLLRFRPGLVSVVTEIQCNIRKAGLNLFEVVLPRGALNSNIEADGLRSSEFKGGLWRLELLNKILGEYTFTITYDIPLGGLSGTLDYTGMCVRGARNQTGFDIVCQEKSDAEIFVTEVVGATAVDESELPREFVERVTLPIIRAYRWTEPERRIVFNVTGHSAGKTLQATVTQCYLKTLLKREGQAINYMSCVLSNTNKQFVKVRLGPQGQLWATYVDGRPVKASIAPDGGVLVPVLSKGRCGQRELALIWSALMPPMGLASNVGLITPALDVQVQAVSWQVFMPGEYQVLSAGGNMEMQPMRVRVVGLPTLVAERFRWLVAMPLAVASQMSGTALILPLVAAWFIGIIALLYRRRWFAALLLGGLGGLLVFLLLPALGRTRVAGDVRLLEEMALSEKPVMWQGSQFDRRVSEPAHPIHETEIGIKQRRTQEHRTDALQFQAIDAEKKAQEAEPHEEQHKKDDRPSAVLRKRAQKGIHEEKDKGAEAASPGAGTGQGAFAGAPSKPLAGPRPATYAPSPTPATVAPVQGISKLMLMQQQEEPTSLVTNLVGGRARGALPIELSFPTTGTVPYEFRMAFAGVTHGSIKLYCIRTGAALCLQGLIALLVIGTGLGCGWRRAQTGTLVALICVVLLGVARYMVTPASLEYLRTAQWAAGLVFIMLACRHLRKTA